MCTKFAILKFSSKIIFYIFLCIYIYPLYTVHSTQQTVFVNNIVNLSHLFAVTRLFCRVQAYTADDIQEIGKNGQKPVFLPPIFCRKLRN